MTDFLRSTHSLVESVPSTSTSTSSNKGSLKSRLGSENKISAPAGREIINLSSRKIHIGRAGAGNAMSSDSTPDRKKKILELLARDREVLESYKANASAKYATGRGGAGAKGHVKIKGAVPNRERALEKEREILSRRKEEREMAGNLRMGRGGHGNLLKVASDDDSSSMMLGRVQSRGSSLNDNLYQGGSFTSFGTTRLEIAGYRHTPLSHRPLSARSGSSQSFYTVQDSSRSPSSTTSKWDAPWETDSSFGPGSSTSMTSKGDSSAIAGSLDSGQLTPTVTDAHSVPSEVSPIEERTQTRRLWIPLLKIGHKPSLESSSLTTTTPSHPNSLLRPFKRLHLPKTRETESIPASVEISTRAPSPNPYTPAPDPINIDTTRPVYPYRTDWTSASNALQMVDPANRTFIPPARILTPPPPSAPPATPTQQPVSDDLESVSGAGYDSSPTSDTFGSITTHESHSFVSTNPSTPTLSTPKLPNLCFQGPVPPRATDIRWNERSLPPVPPASPPESSIGVELSESMPTPTASPSSHRRVLPPSSPIPCTTSV